MEFDKSFARKLSEHIYTTFFSHIRKDQWCFSEEEGYFGDWFFGPGAGYKNKMVFYAKVRYGTFFLVAEHFPSDLVFSFEDVLQEAVRFLQSEGFDDFLVYKKVRGNKIPFYALGKKAEILLSLLEAIDKKKFKISVNNHGDLNVIEKRTERILRPRTRFESDPFLEVEDFDSGKIIGPIREEEDLEMLYRFAKSLYLTRS